MRRIADLSIVTPCLNEEENLPKYFESILNQSVFPNEIIFVDNGSIDASVAIAESYVLKFQKLGVSLKILSEPKKGIVPTRIYGFTNASNELIGSVDADTCINQNWVKQAIEIFTKDKKLVALGGYYYLSNKSKTYNTFLKVFNFGLLCSLRTPFLVLWGGNMVFKKSAYDLFNGLEGYTSLTDSLNLKYVYDDVYLTKMFNLYGKVSYSKHLTASGRAKADIRRVLDQIYTVPRIVLYFHSFR